MLKEPRAKSTFNLQQKNKFQALEDAGKHTPPGTSNINTIWKQIRVSDYPMHKLVKLAWNAARRRGRSESQQIPGKPLGAGEPWRRKSWTPYHRGWKRDTGSAVPRSRPNSEKDDKGKQAGLHGGPGKSRRRGRFKGITRTGVRDHQAHQRQVQHGHRHADCG